MGANSRLGAYSNKYGILNMDRMGLKIEITTVYRLILLPPLSFTEYSQLENVRFGASCWHVIVEVELFLL